MKINMKKVVLLNSGGLDSALLAKKLFDEGFEVHSLWVNTKAIYEEQARLAAQTTANKFCVSHREITVDFGQHSNFFETSDEVIMYDEDPARIDKLWLCPQIPLLSATLGVIYTKTIGACGCYVGFKNRIDEFKIDTFNKAMTLTNPTFYHPPLIAPFYSNETYQESITLLEVIPEDFSYTHSCTHDKPCGNCYKCINRTEVGVDV